jgi:hypothetical protein
MRCAYACIDASGPVWPKPEIEQYTRSGRSGASDAWSSPYFAITPGAKFSTSTSACFTRSSTTSRAAGCVRSIAMPRLPTLSRTK